MDGGVFFATSDVLEDRVRTALLGPDVRGMVLHFAGVNFVDSQGAAAVSEIIRMTAEAGVELRLASVRPAVRRMLERDGVVQQLGADHLHGNLPRALAALTVTGSEPAPKEHP